MISLIRGIWKEMIQGTHKIEADSQTYRMISWLLKGKDGGRDSQGVWDGHGHTAVFHMENQQGPAGQHRGLCSMSCSSLAGRGVWGQWLHVYVYPWVPLLSTRNYHDIVNWLYTTIQNKIFKNLTKRSLCYNIMVWWSLNWILSKYAVDSQTFQDQTVCKRILI